MLLRHLLTLFFCLWVSMSFASETVRLAVTTSFHNSGLADVLLPVIADDINLDVQLLTVGTGQALKLGQTGDVDAILVHSRSAEEAFVANGFGTHRREIMYNDFVLIGPQSDPAGIAAALTAVEGLQRIA
ncbi:MAG: substrate-binding domain-containing protein, partial [Pseudomonadota bacterium]